jgi:NAD(P)-dependent dehydrogenase (short-subunit alcohol dehydrogenase family)
MADEESRVGIITGASRGFGLATARALAEAGWSLVIDARGPDALALVAEELAVVSHVLPIAGDVTDQSHRTRLITAAAQMGGLDLLMNNASILGPSPQPPLASYPLDVFRQVFEVNVTAPLALIQEALPLLRSRRGTIVNVTSDAAFEGYEGWGGYGSSKASLNQLSNVLAVEEPEIKVYWFDPGDMNTRMHQEAFPGEDISDRPPPEASVPPLISLLGSGRPSGHYQATKAMDPA